MSIFTEFANWLKGRVHFRPTELKGAPGVSHPQDAAAHVNAVLGGLIDAGVAAAPSVAVNALHLHPDTLKNAPGISDHALAADAINAIVAGKLGE